MKTRKTTQAEYRRFRKAFDMVATRLGLTDWGIWFTTADLSGQDDPDSDGQLATCRTHYTGATATITFTNRVPTWLATLDVERTAKHEAAHLLLARLRGLAGARYVTQDEMDSEEERVVRMLEKVL